MELLWRPWKLYADAGGRARRSEYWLFLTIRYGLLVTLLVMAGAVSDGDARDSGGGLAMLALVAWLLATFVPTLTLMARRLHDFNTSGKWVLATFVPYIGFLAVIVIGVIPGTQGENDRGLDPRESDADDAAEIERIFR